MEVSDIQRNVAVLEDCLRCHENQPMLLRQTLETIRTLCGDEAVKTEICRQTNGLIQKIIKLLDSPDDAAVVSSAFCCLADTVAGTYENKMILTNVQFFYKVKTVLMAYKEESKVVAAASYCCACVSANNSCAQSLMRDSGCLHVLLKILSNIGPLEGDCDKVSAITSALSSAVNNPQNDLNQHECSIVFPVLISLLGCLQNTTAYAPLISFLSLAVANNSQNQMLLNQCHGLNVLMCFLSKIANNLKHSVKDVDTAIVIINCIDAAITKNEGNCQLCGEQGLLKYLLDFVQFPCLKEEHKLAVLLCIAHATEDCLENQLDFLKNNGLCIVVAHLGQDNEDLLKLIKYIMFNCILSQDKCIVSEELDEDDELLDSADEIGAYFDGKLRLHDAQEKEIEKIENNFITDQCEKSTKVYLNSYGAPQAAKFQNTSKPLCPGCSFTEKFNSRNFKLKLLNNRWTCTYHKYCCLL